MFHEGPRAALAGPFGTVIGLQSLAKEKAEAASSRGAKARARFWPALLRGVCGGGHSS